MTSAAWALQQAVFAALTGDSFLVSLLGGARVYDDVPARGTFPYVTFATGSERDWSDGTEAGIEHGLTLHVWSRAAGRQESWRILWRLREVLHDAGLAVSGHRLVNLRHEASEVRRAADGETFQGIIRFRAVTEPQE
jgi:hypothetical protein